MLIEKIPDNFLKLSIPNLSNKYIITSVSELDLNLYPHSSNSNLKSLKLYTSPLYEITKFLYLKGWLALLLGSMIESLSCVKVILSLLYISEKSGPLFFVKNCIFFAISLLLKLKPLIPHILSFNFSNN